MIVLHHRNRFPQKRIYAFALIQDGFGGGIYSQGVALGYGQTGLLGYLPDVVNFNSKD